MGSFGWAYVNCTSSVAEVDGPIKSVQYLKSVGPGTTKATGSANFLYYQDAYGDYGAGTLELTGTLVISGAISASHYHIEDVTRIDVSGSSWMGNSNDDIHARTGSFFVEDASDNIALAANCVTRQVFANTLAMKYDRITTSLVTSSAQVGIYAVGGSGDIIIRLHSASVAGQGAIVVFKDEQTSVTRGGKVTFSASSPDTIDGQAALDLSGDRPAVNLFSDGTNWWVF